LRVKKSDRFPGIPPAGFPDVSESWRGQIRQGRKRKKGGMATLFLR